ncbi:MAG: hypothetical protein IKW74_04375, partial [Thermoguttaceae bacterium]|nr:hypothetical protein [Thermoguttaceae bacterium]
MGIAGVNGDFYTYAGSDEYSYYNSENSFTNSDETDSGEDYMRSKTPTVIYSEEYDDSESGNVEKIEESIQGSELQPLDVQRRYDNWVTAEELDSKLSQFAWKKGDFRITPYGTLWISSAYDTSAITPGEFALYAKSKDVDNTSDFCVDARTSRVGLMVNGPKIDSFPDTELLGVL